MRVNDEEKFVTKELLELKNEYPFTEIEEISDLLNDEKGEIVLRLWQEGIPLKNAYFAVFIDEVKKNISKDTEEILLKKILTAKRATPGSLGNGYLGRNLSYKNMSKEEFDKLEKKALRGDLKKI